MFYANRFNVNRNYCILPIGGVEDLPRLIEFNDLHFTDTLKTAKATRDVWCILRFFYNDYQIYIGFTIT